jgi:hypothetical protein
MLVIDGRMLWVSVGGGDGVTGDSEGLLVGCCDGEMEGYLVDGGDDGFDDAGRGVGFGCTGLRVTG